MLLYGKESRHRNKDYYYKDNDNKKQQGQRWPQQGQSGQRQRHFFFSFFLLKLFPIFFIGICWSVCLIAVFMSSLCLRDGRNSFSEDTQILELQDVPCSKHKTVFRVEMTRKIFYILLPGGGTLVNPFTFLGEFSGCIHT